MRPRIESVTTRQVACCQIRPICWQTLAIPEPLICTHLWWHLKIKLSQFSSHLLAPQGRDSCKEMRNLMHACRENIDKVSRPAGSLQQCPAALTADVTCNRIHQGWGQQHRKGPYHPNGQGLHWCTHPSGSCVIKAGIMHCILQNAQRGIKEWGAPSDQIISWSPPWKIFVYHGEFSLLPIGRITHPRRLTPLNAFNLGYIRWAAAVHAPLGLPCLARSTSHNVAVNIWD